MAEKKRPQGRQPKWEKFTNALVEVMDKPHKIGYAIIWTDEQLLDAVNELLDEKDRISYRSFSRYKNGEIQDDEILSVFMSYYKRALREQSDNLFDLLSSDVPGGWQRYAWILERKFDEWNMKQKQEDVTPKAKQLVLRVKSDD